MSSRVFKEGKLVSWLHSYQRRMITWDTDHCAINYEMRIDDYLAARRS